MQNERTTSNNSNRANGQGRIDAHVDGLVLRVEHTLVACCRILILPRESSLSFSRPSASRPLLPTTAHILSTFCQRCLSSLVSTEENGEFSSIPFCSSLAIGIWQCTQPTKTNSLFFIFAQCRTVVDLAASHRPIAVHSLIASLHSLYYYLL